MTQDVGPEDLNAAASAEPVVGAAAVDAGVPVDGDELAEEGDSKRRSSAWPWIALAIALLIIVWLIWQYVGRTPSVSDVKTTTTNTEIPVNTTAPSAGTDGGTDTGSGADTATESGVPDVVGMTRSAAENALSAAGYSASVTTVFGDSSPANTVIHQNPSAGSVLSSGNTVGITVQRRSPARVSVPGFVGMSRAAATRKAKAAGFKVVISFSTWRQGDTLGDVRSQWPHKGESQAVGGSVQLQIIIKP
jgi:hypothetical protein